MDSTDIPPQVFHSLFITPQTCTSAQIQPILQWNQTLDPSFNMVKAQFKKWILAKEGEEEGKNGMALCRDVLGSLRLMMEVKVPRNFVRGFLASVRGVLEGEDSAAKKLLLQKLELYQSKWLQISPEILQSYFQTFSLKSKISQQQIDTYIEKMLITKQYNTCLDFIKFLGVGTNKQNIEKLMAKMSNKRDASKAADYVKRLNLDPKNYPALGERLYKNTARHFLKNHGWEAAEEIFEEYPEALACIVQDLIYKKKYQQVLIPSILIGKINMVQTSIVQSKQWLKQSEKQQPQQPILPNTIMSNDIFGPPNTEKYLALSDFGLGQNDVIWVDQTSENLTEVLKDIANSDVLGIDTQSIVGQTKFQKVDEAAIVQISTGKRVYIFDGFKSNDPRISQTMLQVFDRTKIIGHSFTNDTQGILKAFGLQTPHQTTIRSLLDISKIYKRLHQNPKYSSLAHICKQTFQKQLCKDQTLTNWKRRPLRKNQLHYAALDAHIVVEVYKKWIKQFGEIVHYHAEIDGDDM